MDHHSRLGGLPRDALPTCQSCKFAACFEHEAEAEDGSRAVDRPGCVAGGQLQSAAFEWSAQRTARGRAVYLGTNREVPRWRKLIPFSRISRDLVPHCYFALRFQPNPDRQEGDNSYR